MIYNNNLILKSQIHATLGLFIDHIFLDFDSVLIFPALAVIFSCIQKDDNGEFY